MSSYLKISYITTKTNQALMKCIMYIGKYYGDNNTYDLHYGIKYLARNCRTSRVSVRKMIYATNVRGQKAKQWSFKKRTYSRVYRYIINRVLNSKVGNREEALLLLHNLYVEAKTQDTNVVKNISDALVLQQKKMLNWASDKSQYTKEWDIINKILEVYGECDGKYSGMI